MTQPRRVFHEGEAEIQKKANVSPYIHEMAARFIRDAMPDQHRMFFEQLPSIFLGLIDGKGRPWAVPAFGRVGFLESPDDTTLNVNALPMLASSLDLNMAQGSKVGALGLEFHTRRRNRMNGVLKRNADIELSIHVEHSYGNCPQYIQARDVAWGGAVPKDVKPERVTVADERARRVIAAADTFFISSRARSLSDDPRDGLDMSHRGGRPGFLRVASDGTISFPDFSGNRFFNTLGNIQTDGRVGLFIPDFDTRSAVFVTGRATIDWSSPRVFAFKGAERIVDVQPDEVWFAENVIPEGAIFCKRGHDWLPQALGNKPEAAKMSEREKIVVTGMGAVSPLGSGVEVNWSRLLAGKSGLSVLSDDIVGDIACKVGGLVPDIAGDPEGGFDLVRHASVKDQKKLDSFISYALDAADQALTQAGWAPETPEQQARTATIIGSGVGGFHALKSAVLTTENRGARRLSPFTIPSFLVNLASGWVSIRYGFKGPLGAPVTACAAGGQAIGDAVRIIRNGEADVAICGGTEACLDRVSLGGFGAARALSTAFNEDPTAASRPFDAARDGFVMGEGAGLLVIETETHALARGAEILGEISGYGTSADAYHLTAGEPRGDGARRAMDAALRDADKAPTDIDHVNAHATSTPVGDRGELEALKTVFQDVKSPAISSTKGATGHLLGGAGGIEAVFSILAIRDQVVPPMLNMVEPDEAAGDLNLVGSTVQSQKIKTVMSNGFGFGGVNATLIFDAYSS